MAEHTEAAVSPAVTSSPHVRSAVTTARIMWAVFFCLIPSGLVSAVLFGPGTIVIMAVAIGVAAAVEWLWCVCRRTAVTVGDGSACLTGLLLAYNVPPQSPVWMVALGSLVAILFGKLVFGGLGYNIFNPALVGRVFLMASFPVLMTRWPRPLAMDAVTAPTPLAVFKDAFQQTHVFAPTEIINYRYQDLFWGFRGGCIGESCVAALLLGALFLLWRKYISWHIPVSYIATVAVLVWIFGGPTWFSGDVLLHVLSGGLILGAFYMATDYVSGPMTRSGQIIFGVGCGLITAIIRLWGGYPEGVSYSILLMNAAAPLIDRFVRPRRYGLRGGGS